MREWKEAIRHSQRQRYILDHQVRRTENHILARTYLGARHLQVKMRLLGITRRIFATLRIQQTRRITLALRRLHETLALLRIYIRYKRLLRLEIIAYPVRFILIRTLPERRFEQRIPHTVLATEGMHQARIQRYINLVRRKLQVLIVHLTIAEQVGTTVLQIKANRILSHIIHWIVQRTLTLAHSVHLRRILAPQRSVGIYGITLAAVNNLTQLTILVNRVLRNLKPLWYVKRAVLLHTVPCRNNTLSRHPDQSYQWNRSRNHYRNGTGQSHKDKSLRSQSQ